MYPYINFFVERSFFLALSLIHRISFGSMISLLQTNIWLISVNIPWISEIFFYFYDFHSYMPSAMCWLFYVYILFSYFSHLLWTEKISVSYYDEFLCIQSLPFLLALCMLMLPSTSLCKCLGSHVNCTLPFCLSLPNIPSFLFLFSNFLNHCLICVSLLYSGFTTWFGGLLCVLLHKTFLLMCVLTLFIVTIWQIYFMLALSYDFRL